MKYIFFFSFYVLLTSSCSNGNKATNPYQDTTKHILYESTSAIQLPKHFKRSSRYRLKEEMPAIAADTVIYNTVIRALEMIEFTDSNPDFFVDTTSQLHFVAILDGSPIPLTKQIGQMLKSQLNRHYRDIEASNANTTVVEVESNMQANSEAQLLRFKHNIKNWDQENDGMYNNSFLYSTKSKTYNIMEINIEIDDISKYIWSIR